MYELPRLIMHTAFTAAALWLAQLLYKLLLRPQQLIWRLRRQGIRGPAFAPFVGQMPEYKRNQRDNDYGRCYRAWHQTHGSTFYECFGPVVRLNISEPELLRAFIVRNGSGSAASSYYKTKEPHRSVMHLLMGSPGTDGGLLISDGDAQHHSHRIERAPSSHLSAGAHWARIHAVVGSCLATSANVPRLIDATLPRRVRATLRAWNKACEGGRGGASGGDVDASEAMKGLVLSLVGDAIFGAADGETDGEVRSEGAGGSKAGAMAAVRALCLEARRRE